MNKDAKMKQLINEDFELLTLIHSVLSVKEHNRDFEQSDAYIELFESDLITILKRIRKIFLLVILFALSLVFISIHHHLLTGIFFIIILALALFFTYQFKQSIDNIRELNFDLRIKHALKYAFKNYSSKSFDILADQYLSEYSSRKYRQGN